MGLKNHFSIKHGGFRIWKRYGDFATIQIAGNRIAADRLCGGYTTNWPDRAVRGDVTTLYAVTEGIKNHSDSCMPLSKQIIQLAEDFDLDGIQKLADELDAC